MDRCSATLAEEQDRSGCVGSYVVLAFRIENGEELAERYAAEVVSGMVARLGSIARNTLGACAIDAGGPYAVRARVPFADGTASRFAVEAVINDANAFFRSSARDDAYLSAVLVGDIESIRLDS